MMCEKKEKGPLVDNLPELERLLLQEDVVLREAAMADVYQREVFGADPPFINGGLSCVYATEDIEFKPHTYTLGIISDNLDKFEDPVALLKSFLKYPSDDVQLILGGIVANSLTWSVGPEKVFEEFSSLEPNEHWAIHYAMPFMFSLHRKWFGGNKKKVGVYLDGLYRGDCPTELRVQALDAICRHFPYKDEVMTNAIRDAFEDDNPRIRGAGRYLYDCWVLKDSVVKSSQVGDVT